MHASRFFVFCLGIPTLVIAAASVDVVTAISVFGVFLGLAFSEGRRDEIQVVILRSLWSAVCAKMMQFLFAQLSTINDNKRYGLVNHHLFSRALLHFLWGSIYAKMLQAQNLQ